MNSTPALDFCQRVRTWQDGAGAASGLPMLMPDSSLPDLDAILTGARVSGPSPLLEDRARRWLIGYRELESQQRVLTEAQRAELNAVVTCIPLWEARERGRTRRQARHLSMRVAWILIALLCVTGAGISLSALLIGSGNGSPPPAGPVVVQPAGPRAGPLTDLQRFRADWDIPGSATADAGNPHALVLLQDGLYYPSPWGVRDNDAGWAADSSGAITASVHGTQADVTDGDSTTWTVTAGQPFALASNPQAVFRVLRDATVQAMPQPHAIRVRYRI